MQEVKVEGLDELYKQIKKLENSLSPYNVEPLLLEAGNELKSAILLEIDGVTKKKTGDLKKGVKVIQMERRGDNPRSVIVKSTAPHDHLVEFGTSERYQKTTGRATGVGPAHPFFRPAIGANKERVYKEIVDRMRSLVESITK